jgi:hypothetical protein
MLLSEIKNKLDNSTFDYKDIKVKSYLPIVSKMILISGYDNDNGEHIDGIINECVEFNNNGIAYVNHFLNSCFYYYI